MEADIEATMTLAQLHPGQRLRGLVPGQDVTLIAIDPIDATLCEVFYREDSGVNGACTVTDADVATFTILSEADAAPDDQDRRVYDIFGQFIEDEARRHDKTARSGLRCWSVIVRLRSSRLQCVVSSRV